jgi:hypothetical protein
MLDHKDRLSELLDQLYDIYDELEEQYQNVHPKVAEAFHMVGYACSHLSDYVDPEGPLYQIVQVEASDQWQLIEHRVNPDTGEEESVPLPDLYTTHEQAVAAATALAMQDLDNE